MSPLALLKDTTSYFSPLLTGAVAAFTFFLFAKYIYRVTFHPLATFPGPKLAALTSLYGASYDLLPDRSYCKQFPALHDTYGPIVRTWPNHLHIRDMGAYNQIFKAGGVNFDKHAPFYAVPQFKDAYFPIASTKTALARKSMHSPPFSKEAVRRSEHLITDMLAKFLDLLSGYVSGARPVDLTMGVRCLTADISMNYAFQRPFNALDEDGFQSQVIMGTDASSRLFQWLAYFPRFFGGVFRVAENLPEWLIRRYMRPFALVNWCLEVCRDQIAYLQNCSPSEKKIRTVFDINLNPNLEKGQFTPTTSEMGADAFALLVAGTDTVAITTVVITWALLNNPQMMQRLKAELREVMPGRQDTVDWAGLEKLPYLRAVIREGLRLGYGAPGRLPRVVPSSGAVLCGQKIPAGTVVSSSAYVYHQDPHTFTDPQTFRPERWLAPPTGGSSEMDAKFVPFSKGSRSCIGINLAYAELDLIVAHLYRRFDVSNAGTTDADMQWKDCLAPVTKGHLKVTVKESVD